MEEARDHIIKKNTDTAKEYDLRISEGKQELNIMYDEIERLKNEKKEFTRQNIEFKNKCDQLKE